MKNLTIQFAGYGLQDETCIHGFETSAELLQAIARCDDSMADAIAGVSLFDYGTGTMWKIIDVASIEQERRETRNDYRYFKNLSLSLQEQLKEKDKQIHDLEIGNDYLQENCEAYKDELRTNTKQVCEKIRHFCTIRTIPTGDGSGYCEEEYNRDCGFNEALRRIEEFLYQIERGEK